jgi:hydroxymethylglutaryl-CoA reductase
MVYMTETVKTKLRNLNMSERHKYLAEKYSLSDEKIGSLTTGGLSISLIDNLVENAIGMYALPLGLAENFEINGKKYLIPMVTEEPSIIAGSSKAGKIMAKSGGITTRIDEPIATGQIQLFPKKYHTFEHFQSHIQKNEQELIELANKHIPGMVSRGGGVKSIYPTRLLDTTVGQMEIVHVDVDVQDAQGANIINTVTEFLAPYLAQLTSSREGISILTNLTTHRLAKAVVDIEHELLPSDSWISVEESNAWAEEDSYRAATHNKGIMNGISAVALATGNDTRATEAGVHAYAIRSGKYRSLTIWKNRQNTLHGELEIPLSVGTVGGLTKAHPVAKLALEIMNVESAKELAGVMVSVGLAQNFAALLTLGTTGIQAGHMPLHARRLVNKS